MPQAEIDSVEPALVCLEDGPATFTVRGTGFTPTVLDLLGDASFALPRVLLVRTRMADGTWDPGSPPFEIPAGEIGAGMRVRWMGPRKIEFDMGPDLPVPPGLYSVIIENPDGSRAEMGRALYLAAQPVINSFSPDSACRDSGEDLTIAVYGGPFVISDRYLTVFFLEDGAWAYPLDRASDCVSMSLQDEALEVCRRVVFDMPAEYVGSEPPGMHRVLVDTRPGCLAISTRRFVMDPCPAIDAISPMIACDSEEPRTFTLEMRDLLVDPVHEPALTVGGAGHPIDSLGGCVEIDSGSLCETIDFTLPRQSRTGFERMDVAIGGLLTGECCSHDPVTSLVLAPPPVVRSTSILLSPDLDPASVTIHGGFIRHGTSTPVVTMAGRIVLPESVAYCEYIEGAVGVALLCEQIDVPVPADLIVPGAEIPFTVTNPDPVGCTSTEEAFIRVGEAP